MEPLKGPLPPVMIVTTSTPSQEDEVDFSSAISSSLSTKPSLGTSDVLEEQKKTSSSLLGADLQPVTGMAPPKLNVVKKSRLLVNPGKSMVEWMKFQSEKCAGAPKLRKIGLDEISLHDKPGDVWMALNDRVYDVSEYVKYHPGGVEEIMKGAGQDATNMFNQIHRWVNVESILKRNLLGFFVRENTLTAASKLAEMLKKGQEGKEKTVSGQLVPKTKFSEDVDSLLFEIDSSDTDGDLTEECWTVGVLNKERLLLKVILKPPEMWMAQYQLMKALRDDRIMVSFDNNFKKMKVKLKKPEKEDWKAIGSPLHTNNTLMDSREAVEDMYPAKLVKKDRLTHNVYLFTFEVAGSASIGIPAGFHVKIKLNYATRKYTPVPLSILDPPLDALKLSANNIQTSPQKLYFIIKIYPDGNLTKQIDELTTGAGIVELGSVAGSLNLPEFLVGVRNVVLLAAGSGLTPFIKIIQSVVFNSQKPTCDMMKIILLFFNETEDDIIWKDEIEKLSEVHPNIFYFYPVISKPSKDGWRGFTGRVSPKLLDSCFQEANMAGDTKAMICGSYGFNDACKHALRSQSVVSVKDPSDVFVFTG